MRWLLDTNVISENVQRRPYRPVVDWIASQASRELAISIVTLAELRDGAAFAANEERRRNLIEWIDSEVMTSFADRILPLTADVLMDWISLSRKLSAKGTPRVATDLLIASTARVHGLALVSRNLRDFVGTGLEVFNPWTGETHRMESA